MSRSNAQPAYAQHRWLRDHEPHLWRVWTLGTLLAIAAAFLWPALQRTGGRWPAPLDDVYIYFGFARSWAQGHPMAWIPGNGYSSGCTSPLYPLLLAPGYALGLTGTSLGTFATTLALACLYDLCRSLRQVVGRGAASYAVPLLVVAVPLLDWSWWSGMETAVLGALLGRSIMAAHRSLRAPPHRRARQQLVLGGWTTLVLLTRPEAVAFVAPVGIATVYGARALSTAASLARTLGPAVAVMVGQAGLNRWLSGEWAPAGAMRKLITSSPFIEPHQVALEYLKNLLVLVHQAFERGLGSTPLGLALPALTVAALANRRYRLLAGPLLLGAVGTILLSCLNSTARFQNFRYAAPALAMLVMAGTLGVAVVARGTALLRRSRRGRMGSRGAAALLVLVAVLAPVGQLPHQIDHFARASANILEQQGEVARRLAERRPSPRRVLVNDAGAIPYLSGVPAIDGLGLGGFRGLPFARASVHGTPAVVELIERLPDADRPDLLALYPGWWQGLVDVFGKPVDAVRITDNVICAADEKVIYQAEWSTLDTAGAARPGQLDEVDVGDLVDERAHGYRFPAPQGGQLVARTLRLPASQGTGVPRYDGGRVIPGGTSEQFAVRPDAALADTTLLLRCDDDQHTTLLVAVVRAGRVVSRRSLEVQRSSDATWTELRAPLGPVRGGDVIRITAQGDSWRSYHHWLLRP